MKKYNKKRFGIFLAAVMAATTLFPMHGTAAANNSADNPAPEEDTRPHLQSVSSNIMPAADNFDINPPVIEGLTFAENGQTLTPNDTLHFTVSAYDADSEITSIDITITTRDSGGNGTIVSCTKDGSGNLYSGTASCQYLIGNNFHVASVQAMDTVGNYSYLKVTNDDQEPLYQFKLKQEIIDPSISISNLQMQLNDANGDGKLSEGDSVTYTADAVCDSGIIRSASMYIKCQVPEKSDYIFIDYDDNTKKITGTYTIRKETYPAAWRLDYISLLTYSGKNYYFYTNQIEPSAKLDFVVEQEDYDMEKPVIQSIVIDRNGQYVSAGDIITIKVKATDKHLSDYGTAHFSHTVSNVSASETVELRLDRNTNEYTGTITITDSTYPCEWFLKALSISDETGNYADLNAYREGWSVTYPWYYRVKSGNTYVEPLKDVTLDFYGLSKQNSNTYKESLLSSKAIENAGRRMSLKELGVTLPEPEPIEGTSFIGWEYHGILIDENTPLLFDITSNMTHRLTARYDKGCANISLRYMNQRGYADFADITLFVDKETTYNDVLPMLELPSDADTGSFIGFELQNHDGNEAIGNIAYISVKAQYGSYSIHGDATYIDKDGNAAIISLDKNYSEGTKIKDILSDLGTPPNLNGAEFEKWDWQFATWLNEEDELSVSTLNGIRNFNVIAIYKGKTTVQASYDYTDQNGVPAYHSKIVLIDGENLSEADIKANADLIIYGLKHFNGLKLLEWAATFYGNHGRYKNVSFTAQYSNCIITLYYPDGTREQIILDKGASFTLPIEKGNYKDISWQGYDKGATITISEDMYLYATDSEYSDSTNQPNDAETSGSENNGTDSSDHETSKSNGSSSQTPPANTEGIKIPENKIAGITAEIANASAGAAVTVDMKNATVVPKQILESIRGKSIDIILQMGGYRWVINGMDVAATNLKDINLEVKLDTNAIPSSLVQSIAGDQPARQLSLTHNGDFGFRARLILELGSEHKDETANLYYYDSSKKLVFIDAGKIDKDGMASLTFSHASDYVVIIDSKAAAKSTEPTANGSKRKSPKTGE